MTAALRTLLGHRELGLKLLIAEQALPAGALDAPVPWVHSSDLADPTPFLTPGVVLLTTGGQFGTGAEVDAGVADAYAGRLVAAGVAGLGFGSEVTRSGTPAALVEACARRGLPLFEVPYRTPFIAVAQSNAAEAGRAEASRRRRADEAQRAIARAALRPDGLSAILTELSGRLGCWVGLFDAAGRLDRHHPVDGIAAAEASALGDAAERLLRAGRRAGSTVQLAARSFSLQTLGGGDHLRGVLAVDAGAQLDRSARELLDSVIAFAGLALERGAELNEARSLLRTGLIAEIFSGSTTLSRRVSERLWGALPSEPLRVIAVQPPQHERDIVEENLELLVQARPAALFFARDDDRLLVICAEASRQSPLALLKRFQLPAGVSASCGWADIPRAAAQAARARARAQQSGAAALEFEQLADDGVVRLLLDAPEARRLARAAMLPVQRHDAEHGTELVRTARAWLENGCENGATAAALGVHRHTVRTRIHTLEAVLGHELSSFTARADLWAAIVAAGGD